MVGKAVGTEFCVLLWYLYVLINLLALYESKLKKKKKIYSTIGIKPMFLALIILKPV